MEKIINKTAPKNTVIVCSTAEETKVAATIANNFGWVTNRNKLFSGFKSITESIYYNFEEGTVSIENASLYKEGVAIGTPDWFIREYGDGKSILPERLTKVHSGDTIRIQKDIAADKLGISENKPLELMKTEGVWKVQTPTTNSTKLILHIKNVMGSSAALSYVLVIIEEGNVLLETNLFEEKAKGLLESDNVEYVYQFYGKSDIGFERILTKEEATKILLNKINE